MTESCTSDVFVASTMEVIRNTNSESSQKKPEDECVVVITGGNSGVGYALAQRLLALKISLTICLACRNPVKAEEARSTLQERYPKGRVDTVQLDTSSISSVQSAAIQLQEKYKKIDYLYLNAGIMPNTTVNWKHFLWCLLHPLYLLEVLNTGEGLFQTIDGESKDGLKLIFATNLFGHFVLVRKLEGLLCSSGSRIIWTSSSIGSKKHFSIDDIQHKDGANAYSSSKHGINLVSYAFNEKWKGKGVHSHVVCPGFCVTGMTTPMLGAWVWTIMYPVLLLARIVIPFFCVTPWAAAEVLVWLFKADPNDVDPGLIYISQASVFGKGYVKPKKIDFHPDECDQLFDKLVSLQAELEG